MLSEELIKKAAPFAEGFEIVNGWVRTPDEDCRFELNNRADLDDSEWKYMVYPLFLTRVIEGINRHFRDNIGLEWYIRQSPSIIEANRLLSFEKSFEVKYDECENEDQAKTQAIKYVLGKL